MDARTLGAAGEFGGNRAGLVVAEADVLQGPLVEVAKCAVGAAQFALLAPARRCLVQRRGDRRANRKADGQKEALRCCSAATCRSVDSGLEPVAAAATPASPKPLAAEACRDQTSSSAAPEKSASLTAGLDPSRREYVLLTIRGPAAVRADGGCWRCWRLRFHVVSPVRPAVRWRAAMERHCRQRL